MPLVQITPEEARHIMKRRRSERRDELFQVGLNAAATEVMAWDGAIPDASIRQQMAHAIRQLKRPRRTTTKEG
jgi:hypothetical protein